MISMFDPAREREAVVPDGETRYCSVCKNDIEGGKNYYLLIDNRHLGRHEDCQYKSAKKRKRYEEKTEEDWRKDTDNRYPGSDKRRRARGHGYSGGDGFTDIH